MILRTTHDDVLTFFFILFFFYITRKRALESALSDLPEFEVTRDRPSRRLSSDFYHNEK